MRPRHDFPAGRRPRIPAPLARVIARKRRPDRDAGGEPCPVRPDRPLDLSGGAAAALEFDD